MKRNKKRLIIVCYRVDTWQGRKQSTVASFESMADLKEFLYDKRFECYEITGIWEVADDD